MKLLLKHLMFSIALAIIILLPDFVYAQLEEGFLIVSDKLYREVAGVLLISFLVLSIPSQKTKRGFFLFFTILSLIEIVHYAFFHGLLMHYEIMFFFTQFLEVTQSLKGVVQYMMIPVFLWLLQLWIGISLIKRSEGNTVQIRFVSSILVVLLLIVPVSAYKRHNISSMMPTNHSLSLVNSYNSIALFLGKELPKYLFGKKKAGGFQSYEIIKNNLATPRNIIVVMGESLGYKYMHLFDYPLDNTPNLDTYKADKHFIYRKGYASGVDTLTAVPSFFLLKREPQNTSLLGKNQTNLLSLAKKQGYHVHYLTTQKLNIMAPYVSAAERVERFQGMDEKLLQALESIDFTQKNFIVLHQRNSHSPYEDSTPEAYYKYPFKDQAFQQYMLHSYANSILYTDHILQQVIERIKKLPDSVVFITSDHSEMMGNSEEHGRYGHAFLDREVAKVPIMIYSHNIDPTLQESYISEKCYNHYTLGRLIAKTIGYHVVNPNENSMFYIQGTSIDGSNGFIEYDLHECTSLNKTGR